jgi:hypothetical protein
LTAAHGFYLNSLPENRGLVGRRPSAMNVSWSDLNSVREVGDHPYRDGTINVTFAELAIWKNNPDARFQLMRKHPIQSVPGYALGKRVEEEEIVPDTSSLI